ncbi:MAG: hypothetical protein A3C85_04555 [Candidatus Doudnabacteria bacterium RIFCSPHIGHO2_02_FULL_48_21]|uniref:Putative membrane protein insertion efficiency factor n=1 Tax=Candidatus Doudnabacteria bacterium RIFCSPLOWO2_02_FULL_48_13 TaxID=1817845 RepID=A0A1F5QCH3_9BACT|nr:MAG: hypothetical protein A3K05_00510 [Candidatus Doudnabacteria bacterium RIFCSPHIGHO2_01_48_18]OGE79684.1 MAG: hypothetical protein A2668_01140 [Candidatus Doudnabacteria bacterium RIFCSPHIGHO2_01_FULL_48_180]OGE91485.1 MAG: hypothetical protein A3F44_01340 [Candidatus Doudnabacteria bacterium RIFCSPHIGHO2_12_FULL_47_25]OGE93099.1 MAG: hypothetical protein A3C85_04555 [Candidatus Doudnabacteria bacterium RIFCSPHIGHO2_02_FULL_48_21]OGE98106.1 MAG: hypothetical protein A3A83_02515 [Candidatu
MKKIFISLINYYQRFFSPDHSSWGKAKYPYGYCRFSPSCSEYAKQSIAADGIRGAVRAILRVLRCNPLSTPAYDPITKKA